MKLSPPLRARLTAARLDIAARSGASTRDWSDDQSLSALSLVTGGHSVADAVAIVLGDAVLEDGLVDYASTSPTSPRHMSSISAGRPQQRRPGALCSDGAGGRARTDTPIKERDFESRASTNFTTPAWPIEARYSTRSAKRRPISDAFADFQRDCARMSARAMMTANSLRWHGAMLVRGTASLSSGTIVWSKLSTQKN